VPPGFEEEPAERVQAYTFGYERDVNLVPRLESGFGAHVTAYTVGSRLEPVYGSDPVGASIFLRLRPVGNRRGRAQ
jgi:hypothetical protein